MVVVQFYLKTLRKYSGLLGLGLLLFAACNYSGEGQGSTASQGVVTDKDTAQILQAGQSVVQLLKAHQYKELAASVHPELGLRCSPYAFVDTINDVVLMQEDLEDNSREKLLWGYDDSSGEPIMLSLQAYFKQFVYDRNFAEASVVLINNFAEKGNAANNLKAAYPDSDFIEYYIPGTEDNPDWRALRLVFQQYQGKLLLVGIVHDQRMI